MCEISGRNLESWLSGRKRHPAKVKSLELGTVGSNPTGSAFVMSQYIGNTPNPRFGVFFIASGTGVWGPR